MTLFADRVATDDYNGYVYLQGKDEDLRLIVIDTADRQVEVSLDDLGVRKLRLALQRYERLRRTP